MCHFPHSNMPHFGLHCRQKDCKTLDILRVFSNLRVAAILMSVQSALAGRTQSSQVGPGNFLFIGCLIRVGRGGVPQNCLEIFGIPQEPWITNDWARIGARYFPPSRHSLSKMK
uniref:Uncharacterized protein n=1 Tax=Ixodes ricinus TaxID=34613 RepID=A0A0K8RIL5_IXORI